ncbi:MAG: MBL fold metallo-hydrolase [Clostridiales bacterium]|nr:MBL fold metallo-hydrolase [Clostridiales bacterium]
MSLSLCCIASGSKGNCTFVTDRKSRIVIDLGISASRAENSLSALGADCDCDIIVTHSHTDHINGIKTFLKRHPGARVHCQKECARAVGSFVGFNPLIENRDFYLGDIRVTAIPVPHDVPCFGYIIECGGKRAAVVTDIGAVEDNALKALSGVDLLVIEANHDVEMLRSSVKYSPQLKARILSRHGHLSNADCASVCAFLATGGVRNFVLAHLSEENNTPEIARREVESAITDAGAHANIVVASQNAMTGLFEIC